jgi:hypothetical protein
MSLGSCWFEYPGMKKEIFDAHFEAVKERTIAEARAEYNGRYPQPFKVFTQKALGEPWASTVKYGAHDKPLRPIILDDVAGHQARRPAFLQEGVCG